MLDNMNVTDTHCILTVKVIPQPCTKLAIALVFTFIKLMSYSDRNITKAIANFVHGCGIT